MNAYNQYKATILEKGETCTAYGTTVYQVNTCTKDLTNNQYLHVVSLDNESRTIFFETKNNDVVLSDFDGKILIQNNSTIMDIGRVGNGLYLGFTKNKGSGYYNTKGDKRN